MYKTHSVEWNEENISRFWDNQVGLSGEGSYFSKQVGDDLIKKLKKQIQFQDAAYLDYGCGHGHLIECVAKNTHAPLYGCDVSQDSVKETNEKMKSLGIENWKGAKVVENNHLPYDNESFDIITCIEVIEHLSDNVLQALSQEFLRVLKPNGIIVMTTPNQEELKKSTVICPECGCTFHKMQHLRNWSPRNIEEYFSDLFSPIEIREMVLRQQGMVGLLQYLVTKYGYVLMKRPLPHLVYIAKKKDDNNDRMGGRVCAEYVVQ